MSKTVRFDVLAVAKATGFDEADRKIAHLSGTAKKSTSGLLLTAAALAPAIIPIAAAAAGAGAAFVALGAVGLLAFQGIKKEMAAATPIGKQYAASLGVLKGNLAQLEHTAAGGVLTGFQSAVSRLRPLMPALNRNIAQLSSQLGDIGGTSAVALVSLFQAFEPLINAVSSDLQVGARRLADWAASSGGVAKFVAYAQNQLPQVEHTLGQLAVAVGRLVAGFAPLGTVSLSSIGVLAKLITLFPVAEAQVIAPAIAGIVIAYKSLSKVASLGALQKFNLGFSALGPVAGAAGIALGIFTGILGRNQARQAQATAEVNNYTEALKASHGAIDQSIRDIAAKNLQDSGALTAASKLGLSLQDVTAAATGNHAAFLQVSTATADAIKRANDYAAAIAGVSFNSKAEFDVAQQTKKSLEDRAQAAVKLNGAIGTQSGELTKAQQIQLQYIEATTGVAKAQAQAKVTIDGVTTTIEKQTTASGLLKTALDKLNGVSLSVEQTQNSFLDTLGNLKSAQDAGTASIAQNSAKGRVNREVLVSSIIAGNDAAQAFADLTAKHKGLTAGLQAGKQSLLEHDAAIRRAAAAAGLDKGQVNDLIASLHKIPKKITGNVEILTARAKAAADRLKAYIQGLHPIMTVAVHTVGAPNAGAGGHLAARAVGGPVTGGRTYQVNELGQELFVSSTARAAPISGGRRLFTPSQSGSITTAAGFDRLRSAIAGVAKSLTSLSTLSAAAQKAVDAVRAILPGVGSVERGLNAENRALQSVADRRARIADLLKAANQRLADAQKTLREKAASVRSGLLSGFDLSTFAANPADGATGPQAIIDAARAFADRMVAFRAQIIRLQKQGLNKNLLDQLIGQGPSAQADALAQASRAQIKALNAQFARAGVTATRIGGLDAKSLYGAGVAAAKGIVAGLRSQERALDKQMERLGRILVRALNRALGIRSPSAVTALAGKYAALGFAKGIDDNVGHAAAAAGRLGSAAVPNLGNGSYPGKMLGGGMVFAPNINIQAGVIANPAEFRRLLIGEMEKAFAEGGFVSGGRKAMR